MNNIYLKNITDYSVSKQKFDLSIHPKYKYLQTVPKPSLYELEFYYETEDYISHTDRKSSFIDVLYHTIKQFTLNRKAKFINNLFHQKGKLLDIGAGTGDFLITMIKKGWSCTGVEPSQKAIDKALTKNLYLLNNTENLINNSYDLITMWHVLEHVHDLDNQIKDLDKLLKPSGKLIIAVPNFESFDASYYNNDWAAYDVPRHLWHFSKRSMKDLFSDYGFEIEEIKPMYFDAFYVALLSEKYKYNKVNYLRAFYIGLKSNLKARKNMNYSSLIYILKKK